MRTHSMFLLHIAAPEISIKFPWLQRREHEAHICNNISCSNVNKAIWLESIWFCFNTLPQSSKGEGAVRPPPKIIFEGNSKTTNPVVAKIEAEPYRSSSIFYQCHPYAEEWTRDLSSLCSSSGNAVCCFKHPLIYKGCSNQLMSSSAKQGKKGGVLSC